jgi:hypothetical protein
LSSLAKIMNKNRTTPLKPSPNCGRLFTWLPYAFVLISLCFYPLSSKAGELSQESPSDTKNDVRFIRLNDHGLPLAAKANITWNCVLDTKTQLVWEVKTTSGLRDQEHIYSWYNPDSHRNGGTPGYQNGGKCSGSRCDTDAYTIAVNKSALCGYRNWRLPSREELRSLVDYTIHPPQPMIDSRYFPHCAEQFYWSSTPDANDADSAWGIGFALGYDYSYYKYGFGYIRLVTHYRR